VLDRRFFERRRLLIRFSYELVVRLLCECFAYQRSQIEWVIFWHKWLKFATGRLRRYTINHDPYWFFLKWLNSSMLNMLFLNFYLFLLAVSVWLGLYACIDAIFSFLSWFCFKSREFNIICGVILKSLFFRDILCGVIWCFLLATYLLEISLSPRSI